MERNKVDQIHYWVPEGFNSGSSAILLRSARREFERIKQSQIARNASWMLAGQGVGFLLQGAYFILLARLLGATDYGVYGGAFAFTNLLSPYSSLGTGTVLLRYVSGEHKNFPVYWGNVLITTLITGTLISAVLCVAGHYFLSHQSAQLVLAAALSNCIFYALTSETARAFQAFDRMKVFASLSLITNLFRTAVAAAMLFSMHHATAYQWAIASTTVSGVATLVACLTVTFRLGLPHFSLQSALKHSPEGVGYSFAASTTVVYNDIDKSFLSHYGMNFANGIYTMAYRVLDIATTPISAMQGAAVPELFRRGRQGLHALAGLVSKLLKRAILFGSVTFVILVLSAPIIPILVGHQFSEAVLALRWLALIPLMRGIHQITGAALTGAGLQRYRTATQVAVCFLNGGLNFWLIPLYGWRGAAWASLATDGSLAVFNYLLLQCLLRRPEWSASNLPEGAS